MILYSVMYVGLSGKNSVFLAYLQILGDEFFLAAVFAQPLAAGGGCSIPPYLLSVFPLEREGWKN